jgi:hypothetical protein
MFTPEAKQKFAGDRRDRGNHHCAAVVSTQEQTEAEGGNQGTGEEGEGVGELGVAGVAVV